MRAYAFGLHAHPSNEVHEEVQVVGKGDDGVVMQKDTQPASSEAQVEGQGDGVVTQVDMLPLFVFNEDGEIED